MGLNDRGNDNQTFGSTWTVETNVSSNPEELSSRGIGLHGKLYKNVSYEFIGIDNVNIRLIYKIYQDYVSYLIYRRLQRLG